MKLTRQQFLRVLPATVLALSGCAASETAPASTEELVFDHACSLDYATQFTADCYEGGYTMLTLTESGEQFLVTPEDAAEVEGLPESVTVLRQPVRNIYLVSTSVMDLFLALDGLDSVTLSGTQAEGWYLDEARAAMEAGRIAYAGKYSAPDYEKILAANCGLAIENTMIYHTPEVKEQLERFGIPVLVERSSYESGPLARLEWLKFWGILLGKEELAEQEFARQVERLAPLTGQASTGKRCAFFSITANNLANVRKGGDYVARMIEMAGGDYVCADLTDNGNNLSTMNLPLEDFYAGAKDADVLLYNSTIEGVVHTTEELVAKCPLLAEFKAVQSGSVWCTTQSFFQQSTALVDFVLDLHRVFTEDDPADLQFLRRVTYDQQKAPDPFLRYPCPAAGGAVCRQSVLGQCVPDTGGSAGGPDRPRTRRFERGHHHPAAPAPGRDGGAAGGGALGGGLPAADLFCQPHCRALCHGHFQRGQAGVALVMVAFLNHGLLTSSLTLITAAFAGAMASMAFVLAVSRRVQRMSILVICGVMIGYICSAVTEFVVAFAQDSNIVNLHNWSQGSFSGMTWGNVRAAALVVLPALAAAFCLSKPMAAYQMGEAYARSVGINVKAFSRLLVLLSSLLAACVTAFAGPISFVGIAVPHLVKQLFGSARPLVVLPGCCLGGAAFCLLCDLIARSMFAPTELSISAVTAVFGAPVVIWLLVRRGQEGVR